jgi:hypothetical protein
MSDDSQLPKISDFPPGTEFRIKEFNLPLAWLPNGQWVNWFGGKPSLYDPKWLKVDNNWLAESFEEWLEVVADSMKDSADWQL